MTVGKKGTEEELSVHACPIPPIGNEELSAEPFDGMVEGVAGAVTINVVVGPNKVPGLGLSPVGEEPFRVPYSDE